MQRHASRFWPKVNQLGPLPAPGTRAIGRCWEWTKSTNHKGYGKFAMGSGWVMAHRWVYEQYVGAIPAEHVVDHQCRNRACVRPSHLEPVTNRVNIQRGAEYRRTTRTLQGASA